MEFIKNYKQSESLIITFINAKEWGIEPKSFLAVIRRLKAALPETQGELSVVFTDDDTIRKLNKQYRKMDKPTDVLSFSYIELPIEDPMGGPIGGPIGEIFISVLTAKRQATEYKHSLTDEIQKLLVHGVLHVFGYDHGVEGEYKMMRAMEEKILSI